MIFPDVRLSRLTRERDERAAAFDRSGRALIEEIREQAKPINILKRHPGVIAGVAMSAMSLFGLSRVGSRNGDANGNGHAESGFLGKLISFGTGFAARNMGPLAAIAMRAALSSFFKYRRRGN